MTWGLISLTLADSEVKLLNAKVWTCRLA